MKNDNNESSYSFYKLNWDTDFFGVKSAKAILHKPLILTEWNELKDKFNEYKFVSIENCNSEPINAQFIGKDTKAILTDVNIQFLKNVNKQYSIPENITVHQALEPNEQIIRIAEFQYSKFIEDPELAKRGGKEVYNQWILNSFGKEDKFFALSKDENDQINGFLLFSYVDNTCVVELIAVSKDVAHYGIGTSLFNTVENAAFKNNCDEIRVGTQIRNLSAINFYQKIGCKQLGSHQVYHLWNL